MKTNAAGLELIKTFEVPKDGDPSTPELDPYLDPLGVWTIAWGHVITDPSTGRQLKGAADRVRAKSQYPHGVSPDEAEVLLASDLEKSENAVTGAVNVELNENQFSALVSLCFNIGETAFASSTLAHLLNMGDFDGASNQFARWNKGTDENGAVVVMPGLTRRREAERMLFCRPIFTAPKPILQTKTVVGAGAGAAVTIGSAATQLSQVVTDPSVKMAAAQSGWVWLPIALSLLAAVAFGIIIYVRFRDRKAGIH